MEQPPPKDLAAKERLFAAAEALVAERGFEAVTSRDITARAGVNLAAINYHYGSKIALFLEIFRVRAGELNRERNALLKAALGQQGGRVEAILHALVAPTILWVSEERRTALRFLNRARAEGPPDIREIIRTDVRHLRRFAEALKAALPLWPEEEIFWRLHFVLGALHHNSDDDYARLATLSGGKCAPDDRQALLERLLGFVSAGFLGGATDGDQVQAGQRSKVS